MSEPPAKSDHSFFPIIGTKFMALLGYSDTDIDRHVRACAENGKFLEQWGKQAYALGWTLRELFGPDGLVSHLEGRSVVALTNAQAVIQDGDRQSICRRPRRLTTETPSLDEALGKILPFVNTSRTDEEGR